MKIQISSWRSALVLAGVNRFQWSLQDMYAAKAEMRVLESDQRNISIELCRVFADPSNSLLRRVFMYCRTSGSSLKRNHILPQFMMRRVYNITKLVLSTRVHIPNIAERRLDCHEDRSDDGTMCQVQIGGG